MRRLIVLLFHFFLAPSAFALTPREQLVGSWFFKRGIGHPCNSLILDLEYHFYPGGDYSTRARMQGGTELSYKGTYVATDTTATATVDGRKIGPYPYTIKNGVLRITQPDNNCDVELIRE